MKTRIATALTLALLLSSQAVSAANDKPYMKCGPFVFATPASEDGWVRINGLKPVSQKVTFIKQQGDYENIQMQWIVPRTDFPGHYGMDYIKHNGKATLNVEAIRSNMNELRMFGTYDCKKVK